MQPQPIEAIGAFHGAPSVNELLNSLPALPAQPPVVNPSPPTQEANSSRANETNQGEGKLNVTA